jgi:hypothetical protein
MSKLAKLLFCAEFAIFFLYYTSGLRIYSYLKQNHREKWLELGSPSFLNNSVLTGIRFSGFFYKRKYLLLGDRRLNRLFFLLWILFIALLFLFISWIVALKLSS